jgi:predicted small lipoprotein YifL
MIARFALAAALAAALGLAGCGRKGPLELPPDPAAAPAPQANEILPGAAPDAPPEPKKDSDFILDPLLE